MLKDYIPRKLELNIARLAKKFPIVTILGPRQSGKTTLLQQKFPDYDYITLESPDTRTAVLNDPRGFLDQYKNNQIIIDEFQRIPELTSYLQEYADAYYSMGQVFLTGSQQYNIAENVSQSLVGRTAILKLLPFSLEEIQSSFPSVSLENRLLRGSYPAVFDRDIAPGEWYPSYVETYLERDVRQLIRIGNLDTFILFLKILAGRASHLLNLNNVGTEVGISQPTARQWLSILLDSQLTFLLQPFHRNINKRLIKTAKLYFSDTGLLCFLLGIRSENDLNTHPLRSSVFENLIISEFYKYNHYSPEINNLLFYRDKSGREVDLITEKADILNLYEIKYSKTIQQNHFRHLQYLSNQIPVHKTAVIYAGNQQFPNVLGWESLHAMAQILK